MGDLDISKQAHASANSSCTVPCKTRKCGVFDCHCLVMPELNDRG